jgi:hypothetical protein
MPERLPDRYQLVGRDRHLRRDVRFHPGLEELPVAVEPHGFNDKSVPASDPLLQLEICCALNRHCSPRNGHSPFRLSAGDRLSLLEAEAWRASGAYPEPGTIGDPYKSSVDQIRGLLLRKPIAICSRERRPCLGGSGLGSCFCLGSILSPTLLANSGISVL